MNKSESIASLAKALSEFQGEVKQPMKDKDNPFFKSKYVPLENVVEAITETAPKHGLSFIQFPINQDDKVGIVTILMHSSGEYIETDPVFAKPGKNDAQATGSVVTYLKRYSLSAVFGITSDSDDDGNEGSQQPQQTKQPYKAPPKPDGMVTPKQKQMIAAKTRALSTKLGIEQLDVYKAAQSKLSITKSTGDLTADEASKVIGYLIEQEG